MNILYIFLLLTRLLNIFLYNFYNLQSQIFIYFLLHDNDSHDQTINKSIINIFHLSANHLKQFHFVILLSKYAYQSIIELLKLQNINQMKSISV